MSIFPPITQNDFVEGPPRSVRQRKGHVVKDEDEEKKPRKAKTVTQRLETLKDKEYGRLTERQKLILDEKFGEQFARFPSDNDDDVYGLHLVKCMWILEYICDQRGASSEEADRIFELRVEIQDLFVLQADRNSEKRLKKIRNNIELFIEMVMKILK
jgi:hypothetical protein